MERFSTDVKKLSFDRSYEKRPVTVLTVSRLTPPKEILTLVRAADIVCRRDPRFEFLIVGEGSERGKIEKLVDELDLRDKVILAGMVSDEMLPRYYKSADIFVSTHPSIDQFWIVVLEAMSSGLPVIWTSVSDDLEGLEGWGMPVPPKRPEVLAKRILEVAYDDKLREEMVKNGLTRVKKYDWNELIVRYETAYKSVIRRSKELK